MFVCVLRTTEECAELPPSDVHSRPAAVLSGFKSLAVEIESENGPRIAKSDTYIGFRVPSRAWGYKVSLFAWRRRGLECQVRILVIPFANLYVRVVNEFSGGGLLLTTGYDRVEPCSMGDPGVTILNLAKGGKFVVVVCTFYVFFRK